MKRTIAIIGAAVMIVAVAVYANTNINTAQQSDASCPNRPGCICEPAASQEPVAAQEPAAAEANCPDTPECVCLQE